MNYKIHIRKEKEQEFLKMMEVLSDLQVVHSYQKQPSVRVEGGYKMLDKEEYEGLAEEFTSNLASTELANRYRDLVD